MWVCVSTGGDVPHTPSRQQTAPGTPAWPSVQEVLLQRDAAPNCPQSEHPEGGDTAVPRAGCVARGAQHQVPRTAGSASKRAGRDAVWAGGAQNHGPASAKLPAGKPGQARAGSHTSPALCTTGWGEQRCLEVPRNKAREGARPPASCPGVPTRSLPHPCPARGRGSGGRCRAAHTRLCVLAGFTSRGRSRRGVGRAPGRPRPRSCARSAASRIPGAARQAPVCVGAGQVRGHRQSWPPWGSRSPPSGSVPPCPPCPHLPLAPHCGASWAGLRAGCNPAPLPLWGSRAGLGAAPLQGTSPYRVPVAGRPWGPHRRGGSPHSPRPGGSAGQGDPGGGGAGGLAAPSDRSKCQTSGPLRGLGTWARAQPAQTGRGGGQHHPSTPL